MEEWTYWREMTLLIFVYLWIHLMMLRDRIRKLEKENKTLCRSVYGVLGIEMDHLYEDNMQARLHKVEKKIFELQGAVGD